MKSLTLILVAILLATPIHAKDPYAVINTMDLYQVLNALNTANLRVEIKAWKKYSTLIQKHSYVNKTFHYPRDIRAFAISLSSNFEFGTQRYVTRAHHLMFRQLLHLAGITSDEVMNTSKTLVFHIIYPDKPAFSIPGIGKFRPSKRYWTPRRPDPLPSRAMRMKHPVYAYRYSRILKDKTKAPKFTIHRRDPKKPESYESKPDKPLTPEQMTEIRKMTTKELMTSLTRIPRPLFRFYNGWANFTGRFNWKHLSYRAYRLNHPLEIRLENSTKEQNAMFYVLLQRSWKDLRGKVKILDWKDNRITFTAVGNFRIPGIGKLMPVANPQQ